MKPSLRSTLPLIRNAYVVGLVLLLLVLVSPLSTCSAAPSSCWVPVPDMIAWWPADTNTVDVIDRTEGQTPYGMTYSEAVVDTAFVFDGSPRRVIIPDSPKFQLSSLSIEGWVKILADGGYIFFRGDNRVGYDPYTMSVSGPGRIAFQIGGQVGQSVALNAPIAYSNWVHVAGTFNGADGNMRLYVDGALLAETNIPFLPLVSLDAASEPGVAIGNHAGTVHNHPFTGLIDNLEVYSRALYSNEVWLLSHSLKCPLPPTISVQPTNQTLHVGEDLFLVVECIGDWPQTLRWRHNGQTLPGQTNFFLAVTNIQTSNAGAYSFWSSNRWGVAESSNAIVVVLPPSTNVCANVTKDAVAWWTFEANEYTDIVTGVELTNRGASLWTKGVVGQSYVFYDTNGVQFMGASSGTLDLGASPALTIETWIRPWTLATQQAIVEWNNGAGVVGVNVFICIEALGGPGSIFANLPDTSGNDHYLASPANVLKPFEWQHVALTYEKASGVAQIFLNGALVASELLGSFDPQTKFALNVGRRISGPGEGSQFQGQIDELSLYRRALSANEVKAIFDAESAGKCRLPIIVQQPRSFTVDAGAPVTLKVAATGAPPLSYQWRLHGTNILGATDATLVISAANPTHGGPYSVAVSNPYGETLSQSAVLEVLPGIPPTFTKHPASLTVVPGGDPIAYFSVEATGTLPLFYQWRLNGAPIPGATDYWFAVTNATVADAGVYSAQVSSFYGSADSQSAFLRVGYEGTNCVPRPAGLVSWWRASTNGFDQIGGLHGTVVGVGYAPGLVGHAFSFDGINDTVTNRSPGLTNITDSYSIEFWAKPSAARAPTLETTDGLAGMNGQRYAIFPMNGGLGLPGAGVSVGTNGVTVFEHASAYMPSLLVYDTPIMDWTHIAVVYSNRQPNLYLNGMLVRTGLRSTRPSCPSTWLGDNGQQYGFYAGLVDEISIYDRSLSSDQVRSIYLGGNFGKCTGTSVVAPSIVQQPDSMTLVQGQSGTFSVLATGSSPLQYRWYFLNSPASVPVGTNSTLTFNNVQASQAGSYIVWVYNSGGAVASSNVVLNVVPAVSNVCSDVLLDAAAWWQFEGSLADSISGIQLDNQGGVGADRGVVGRGCDFSNTNDAQYLRVPAGLMDIGLSPGLTLEAWIKPSTLDVQQTLLEWNDRNGHVGVNWFISIRLLGGIGSIFFNLKDTGGADHYLASDPNVLSMGNWQHVAVTYEKATGMARIFLNGVVVAVKKLGTFTPDTQDDLIVGRRVSGPGTGSQFSGGMDELTLYHRALSETEVRSIFSAGSLGKCVPSGDAPVITKQPASVVVQEGAPVEFTVTAEGSQPLLYQWWKQGESLSGKTNLWLSITNTSLADAGDYLVQVYNSYGTVFSSNATLVVQPRQTNLCASAGPDVAAWWSFDNTLIDLISGIALSNVGGFGCESAVVGNGYSFFNTNGVQYLSAPAGALDLGTSMGFSMETWIKPWTLDQPQVLAEWNDGNGNVGVDWFISIRELGGYGSVFTDLKGTDGVSRYVASRPEVLKAGEWQHVAVTYDRSNGVACIFLNGAVVATNKVGSFTPQTSYTLNIGRRTSGPGIGNPFRGVIDELTMYRRALQASEVRAIYDAGALGKCRPTGVPVIVLHPDSTTAYPGATASFTVSATGEAPLRYQWLFNGLPLAGETNLALVIPNVQAAHVGNYWAVVSNPNGATESAVAALHLTNSDAAPVITRQPSSHAVDVGTMVSFDVEVSGAKPLSYLWRKDGSAIPGGTNPWLIITNAMLSDAGSYSVTVTNSYGVAFSSNAVLTVVPLPSPLVRVVDTNAVCGASFRVPIQLQSRGDVGALSFSLEFPADRMWFQEVEPTSASVGASLLVNTNLLANGQVGVAIALPAGSRFSSQVQTVAILRFAALPPNSTSTNVLSFGDSPITRQVADSLGNIMSAEFSNGVVRISPGVFEGDVAPRFGGDGSVTVADWVMIGRMAARQLYPSTQSEFTRADCAPRATLGDGVISVTDWVQAGRYAAALDPLTATGGPTSRVVGGFGAAPRKLSGSDRLVKVTSAGLSPGSDGSVNIELIAQGAENALGFSLKFDPAVLEYRSAALASDASSAMLEVNIDDTALGRIGVVLALPAGHSFEPGAQHLLRLTFTAKATTSLTTALSFVDEPVSRELADVQAESLGVVYQAVSITIDPRPALNLEISNSRLVISWPAWAWDSVLETTEDASLQRWSNSGLTPAVTEDGCRVEMPVSTQRKFFRLRRP